MDDFEDRARRAGDALNDSVIDLEPADVTPPPLRTRRGAGVALAVLVGLIAAGVAVAQRDDRRDSLRADLPPSTTEPAPAAPPRYLPRWLPDDMAPSKGAVGVGCGSSTGQSVPTISLPPGVHSADLTGTFTETIQIRSATAAALDSSGCQGSWWTAIFVGRSSVGPRGLFLHGGSPSAPPAVPPGAEAVTVHGRAASLSLPSSSSPSPWFALSWNEGDVALSMTGIGLTRDELLKIAESVEQVSDDEWNDVIKPSQYPTLSPTFAGPDLTTATELARLSSPDGQLIRLLAMADGSRVCVSGGNSLWCTSATAVSTPPRITAMSGGYGLILLPAGLPADFTLRRPSGETLPSARSSDGRYLLIADASLGTDYEIVDTTGQVLVTVKGFPCATSATASTPCTAPATTR